MGYVFTELLQLYVILAAATGGDGPGGLLIGGWEVITGELSRWLGRVL